MPHKCTKCGKIFEDGDPKILEGCECGNNKFIYIPKEKKKEEIERIECIRIIEPGKYELNIEKLLESEAVVVAIKEDGKYAIHLPSLLKKKTR